MVYDSFRDYDVYDTDPNSPEYNEIMEPSHVVNVNKLLADAGLIGFKHYIVGIDYGTTNPTSFVLIGFNDMNGPKYIVKEYYFDSRKDKRQKTDLEYAKDLIDFITGYNVSSIYVDPSAASFIVQLGRLGIHTTNADNSVLDGIRFVNTLLSTYNLYIDKSCENVIREFGMYIWDEKYILRTGEDSPLPENDHSLDAIRYALYTMFGGFIYGIIGAGNRK